MADGDDGHASLCPSYLWPWRHLSAHDYGHVTFARVLVMGVVMPGRAVSSPRRAGIDSPTVYGGLGVNCVGTGWRDWTSLTKNYKSFA
jgi:hypothetical protein